MSIIYYKTDILLFDIVQFSKLPNEKQLATAMVITEKLKETVGILVNQAFLQQNEVLCGFIPTGDGFYIILQPEFAGYGIFLAISLRSSLLLASKQAKDLFSGVRAAVHMGDAFPFKDINGRDNFVGDGLNDCARLLCKRPDPNPTAGIPADQNYVVASEAAYNQFEETYPPSKNLEAFFNSISFKKGDYFDFPDKYEKKHKACFVECSRYVAIKPPPPPDMKERMTQLAERLRGESGRVCS